MKKEFLTAAHSTTIDKIKSYYGWWKSRKYDGFSAVWDGGLSRGKRANEVPWYKKRNIDVDNPICTGLWTRKNHIIYAPDFFLNELPMYMPVQGEIWYNDDRAVAAVCNCKDCNDDRWYIAKLMTYNLKPYCFWEDYEELIDDDFVPAWVVNSTLAYRLSCVKEYIKISKSKSMVLALQEEIDWKSIDKMLNDWEENVNKGNWEGYIFANPLAEYAPYRTNSLLKVKPLYDTEVRIIGYNDGEGRHVGRLGSLKVQKMWRDEVETFHGGNKNMVGETVFFNVGGGFSDEERDYTYVKKHYPIGGYLTINFNEVGSNGSIPSARKANQIT